jgi:hypothetical protein
MLGENIISTVEGSVLFLQNIGIHLETKFLNSEICIVHPYECENQSSYIRSFRAVSLFKGAETAGLKKVGGKCLRQKG